MPTATPIEQLDPNFIQVDPETGLHWYDVQQLGIEGQGWTDTARRYARYPARAEGVVRPPVWELAQHAAGLCVRFVTDAPSIAARWTLFHEQRAMDHMPATGVSGLDLYVREADAGGGCGGVMRHHGSGEEKHGGPRKASPPWHTPPGRRASYHWIGTGVPSKFPDNQYQLVDGLAEGSYEFLLYFPLYNGVEKVEIGLPPEAMLQPARRTEKPIVMYGTSILHGGCAARPGMAYPAILGRSLDHPVINLGFSGNGKAEPEVADLLAELDPAVYVLDYCPNLGADEIAQRTGPFVQTLRAAHPDTPIVLVENILYQKARYIPSARDNTDLKHQALREAYQRLREAGVKHLLYIPGEHLLGDDGEGTVDGTHPTDVGFMRMAQAIGPIVEALL